MKKTPLILFVVFVIGAVAINFTKGPRNIPDALISEQAGAFGLHLSRWGGIMVHDPISLVTELVCPTTVLDTETLIIPRDQGVIEGREIPHKPGYYGFLGTIRISGTDMVIDLRVDDTDDHAGRPSIWNGQYHLQPGVPAEQDVQLKRCYQ